MRAIYLCFLLVVMTQSGFAQQEAAPSLQDGPIPERSSVASAPQADSDGVYQPGRGISLPEISDAIAAVYPTDAAADERPHICILSAVIAADGDLRKIRVTMSAGDIYDQAALDAVRQSKFEPGSLDGKPVPVHVQIRVPFVRQRSALPRIVSRNPDAGAGRGGSGPGMNGGETHPTPILMKGAEYSEEARKKKVEGVVTVSLVVDAEGLPTEVKLVKGVGYGLDEKALQAVRQYRFKPAMRGDKPIAVQINVQVQFRLY